MKNILFLISVCAILSCAEGKNLLRNSSFELGSAEYSITAGIPYSASDFSPGKAETDASTRIHGKYSLFFPNPKGNTMQFSSHDLRLIPGRHYTFSCWIKAEKNTEVEVRFRSCSYDSKGYHWKNALTVWNVTPGWKQYRFPFPAMSETNPTGNLLLIWTAEKLWLDAASFSETSAPYSPAEPIETAFDRGGNPLLFPGKHHFTVKAVNYSNQKTRHRVALELYDVFYRKSVPLKPVVFDLDPGTVAEQTVSVNLERYGTFELRMNADSTPLLFSVIGELPVRSYSFRNGFSVGINGHLFHIQSTRFQAEEPDKSPKAPLFGACGMNLDEFFARTRQCGFGSIRLHDDGVFYWWRTEHECGRYDWRITDNIIRKARKNGLDVLPRLGSSEFVAYDKDKFAGTWIRKAGKHTGVKVIGRAWRILPPPEAWERFIYEFVSRYRNEIQCYEIINEPNLFLTPEQYTDYLKRAYRAAKKADPDSVVVGFCATGDLNGNLGKFLEDCGKLGAFQFADAVSFHPYSAQLDDSPVPAEQQIRQVFAILRKYRKDLPVWNSELYFIQSLKGLRKPVAEHGEFPVGNLVRRYLIDLGEGLAQSIPAWAPRITGVDLRPEYRWPNYAASTFIPNEYAAATNAFSRFLECGKGRGAVPLLRGLSAWSYEDRNGSPLLACWAKDEGETFLLILPENMQAYDLFGNPLPGKKVETGNNPVYLKSRDRNPDWKAIQVIPRRKLQVTGARILAGQGKRVLAVEIRNNTNQEQQTAVRIPGTPKQEFTLKPQGMRTIHFPVPAAEKEEVGIIVSDGSEILTHRIRPVSGKFCRPGEKQTVGRNAEFQIRTTPEFLEFQIQVRDDKRGGRIKDAPWSGDGVELFLDTAPGRELDRQAYTDSCYRLFLVPESSNGLPEALTGSPNLDLRGIVCTLNDSGSNYTAAIRIPWKNLGLQGPSGIAFDLAVDDSDGERRHRQDVWAGGAENWRNRFLFGFLLLP